MVRPSQPGLTENELEVIKLLWVSAPLTVAQIRSKLIKKPLPAYTSLLTLMQSMEKKGYVKHQSNGKAYHYFPILKRERFLTNEIKRIATRLFDGSPGTLVLNLVDGEHLTPKEITSLKKLLEEK